jgi:hypothetical protein
MLTTLVTIISTLFIETLITYAIGARRFGWAWPVKVYRTYRLAQGLIRSGAFNRFSRF